MKEFEIDTASHGQCPKGVGGHEPQVDVSTWHKSRGKGIPHLNSEALRLTKDGVTSSSNPRLRNQRCDVSYQITPRRIEDKPIDGLMKVRRDEVGGDNKETAKDGEG